MMPYPGPSNGPPPRARGAHLQRVHRRCATLHAEPVSCGSVNSTGPVRPCARATRSTVSAAAGSATAGSLAPAASRCPPTGAGAAPPPSDVDSVGRCASRTVNASSKLPPAWRDQVRPVADRISSRPRATHRSRRASPGCGAHPSSPPGRGAAAAAPGHAHRAGGATTTPAHPAPGPQPARRELGVVPAGIAQVQVAVQVVQPGGQQCRPPPRGQRALHLPGVRVDVHGVLVVA
jgi:hypothetical protein